MTFFQWKKTAEFSKQQKPICQMKGIFTRLGFFVLKIPEKKTFLCVETSFFFGNFQNKKIDPFLQMCVKSESNLKFQLPWVQIPFKIHANRGVLDQICVVGPESGRRQSILGLLRVLRIPRHRFGTTRMPQPTFCFRPLRISLVNLNPWNPYYSKQVQPRVINQFGPALAHNGWNVLKIWEHVLLTKIVDIRDVIFLICDISIPPILILMAP